METSTAEGLAPPATSLAPAGRLSSRLEWLGDGLAFAALGWLLLQLSEPAGGVDTSRLLRATWPLAAAVPVAAIELTRLPRRVSVGFAAFPALMALALVGAQFRSDFVQPSLLTSVMLVTALLTARVWRRPWGPVALVALLAGSLAVGWLNGLLVWVGGGDDPGRWLSLPWHNQSGTLLAAAAVFVLGVALAARTIKATLVLASASGVFAAAAWLAGSRGAAIAGILGIVVLAAWSRLRRPWAWATATAAALLVLFALMPQAGGVGDALSADKGLSASESSLARFHHMHAAVQMTVERPVLGWGPGSYRLASGRYAAPHVHPTSHAHNEYVEWFAEGGLPLGLTGLAIMFGLGTAVWRCRGRWPSMPPGARQGATLGSCAAVVVLAAHAAIDFDWLFPVLGVLFAVCGSIAYSAGRPLGRQPGTAWAAIPLALLLAAGMAGAVAESNDADPWDALAARAEARNQHTSGDLGRAAETVADGLQWNPADPVLAAMEGILAYERGDIRPEALVRSLPTSPIHPVAHLYAAEALAAGGDSYEAAVLATEVQEMATTYHAWGLESLASRAAAVVAGLSQ